MAENNGPDPRVIAGLNAAKGLIPVQPDDRFRMEVVITGRGEMRLSLPQGPGAEEAVWKVLAYLPDSIKQFYNRSPLAV